MSTLLANALVWHVFSGLAGIIAFTAFLLETARQDWTQKFLRLSSLGGFLAFLVSWISGGYYYTTYYGKAVKPVIIAGRHPWVHKILMEAKEHIFLFLPFLAFVVFAIVGLSGKELTENKKLKKALIGLGFLIITLGVLITLSGFAISGAVDKKL